jgi:hypothetical protein
VPRHDVEQANPAGDEEATLTPLRKLERRLEAVDGNVVRLPVLLKDLEEVTEDDGRPVIEREGIDDGRAQRWTDTFVSAITVINNHNSVYNKQYGSLAEPEDDETEDGSGDD